MVKTVEIEKIIIHRKKTKKKTYKVLCQKTTLSFPNPTQSHPRIELKAGHQIGREKGDRHFARIRSFRMDASGLKTIFYH